MRVLLINPYYPISETPSPPLGLAYLGAALEQPGVQVKLLDYVVYPYLAHINKRIQNGRATADESRQLQGLEKAVMLYELMMGNIIEENGLLSLSDNGSKMNAEKGLAVLMDRITRSSDRDPNELKVTLQQAVADGNLKLNHKNGTLRWEWESA